MMKKIQKLTSTQNLLALTCSFNIVLGSGLGTIEITKTLEHNNNKVIELKENNLNSKIQKQNLQKKKIRLNNAIHLEKQSLRKSNINQKPQKTFQPINVHNITRYDLRTPSNLTVEQAEKILKNTNLEGLGSAYVTAEQKYGVNALYLIAHSALESGWGTSKLAKEKNNLFGIGAYDSDPYNSAFTFKSKEECILFIAQYISKEYLNENGKHYNGPHLEGIGIKYASDKEWAQKVSDVIIYIQRKI